MHAHVSAAITLVLYVRTYLNVDIEELQVKLKPTERDAEWHNEPLFQAVETAFLCFLPSCHGQHEECKRDKDQTGEDTQHLAAFGALGTCVL